MVRRIKVCPGARRVMARSSNALPNLTKGTILERSILYGSEAYPMPEKERLAAPENHTHRWTVFVRDVNGGDLTHYIKSVTFKLHQSFENPNRKIEAPPFQVTETGWGEFEIGISIKFIDANERQTSLVHHLTLHPREGLTETELMPNGIKKVIAQRYEELLFVDPTEQLHEALTSHPQGPPSHPTFNPQAEQSEVQALQAALKKLSAEEELLRERIAISQNELDKLKRGEWEAEGDD